MDMEYPISILFCWGALFFSLTRGISPTQSYRSLSFLIFFHFCWHRHVSIECFPELNSENLEKIVALLSAKS
jgi:hypothetical protein